MLYIHSWRDLKVGGVVGSRENTNRRLKSPRTSFIWFCIVTCLLFWIFLFWTELQPFWYLPQISSRYPLYHSTYYFCKSLAIIISCFSVLSFVWWKACFGFISLVSYFLITLRLVYLGVVGRLWSFLRFFIRFASVAVLKFPATKLVSAESLDFLKIWSLSLSLIRLLLEIMTQFHKK